MPVVEQTIAAQIQAFITKQQAQEQEDSAAAIKEFSDELAKIITNSILSLTITIQSGQIIVAGSPSTQTNPAPLVLQGQLNLK